MGRYRCLPSKLPPEALVLASDIPSSLSLSLGCCCIDLGHHVRVNEIRISPCWLLLSFCGLGMAKEGDPNKHQANRRLRRQGRAEEEPPETVGFRKSKHSRQTGTSARSDGWRRGGRRPDLCRRRNKDRTEMIQHRCRNAADTWLNLKMHFASAQSTT